MLLLPRRSCDRCMVGWRWLWYLAVSAVGQRFPAALNRVYKGFVAVRNWEYKRHPHSLEGTGS